MSRASTLRLPAYAAALVAKRRAGLAPRQDLLIATAWNLGRAWAPWRIVVGHNHTLADLDFTLCAGLSCLLFGHEEARMHAVAQAILPAAPRRLVGVAFDVEKFRVYVAASSGRAV